MGRGVLEAARKQRHRLADRRRTGTVATATDPANGTNSTTYTVDATTHQLTGITPVSGGTLAVRAFTYDRFARLATATDGAGRTTTYNYDFGDRTPAPPWAPSPTTRPGR